MEFKDRGINQQDSSRIPPIYSYFTERTHRAGSMGSDIGRTHQEFFPDHHYLHHLYSPPRHLHYSLPSPSYPHDLHEEIQIEIEKERIREEIIISEIARRRVLEAEARRELMVEIEFAPRTSGEGFSFRSSPRMEPVSPMGTLHMGARADESSLEERITMLLNGKRQTGGFGTLPFQRGTADLRVSEVKPVSGGGHEKEKQKVIFLGKPDENISGSKKKTVPPPRVDTSESGGFETLPFIKTADLRVSEFKPVSEGGRDREKPKVIFLGKPDENISGSKRKAVTPPRVDASDFPSSGGGILHKKPKEEWICAICQVNTTSERALNNHLGGKKHKSKEAAFRAAEKVAKSYSINELCPPKKGTTVEATGTDNTIPDKGKYPFWCEMCKVGTFCEKDKSNHEKGRKHVNRRLRIQNGGAVVNNAEWLQVAEDRKNMSKGSSSSVDETTNDEFVNLVKHENLELVHIAKPENHELVEEVMEEEDWAAYITEPENGVTDGIVEHEDIDGGAIVSRVEPFVPAADDL